jgi:hypothetical protein
MTDERKAKPAPPPRGMIEIDGTYEIRRYGLVWSSASSPASTATAFKARRRAAVRVAKPCGHMEQRESQIACGARLYHVRDAPADALGDGRDIEGDAYDPPAFDGVEEIVTISASASPST